MTRCTLLTLVTCGLVIFTGENRLNAQSPAPAPQTLETMLAVDASTKEFTVTNGTPDVHYTFNLTNVSPAEVVISGVFTSCGCTAAKLPEQPWKLAPGTNGQVNVTLNLAGKSGTVTKSVTISSTNGVKLLFVKAVIIPTPATPPPAPATAGH